MTKIYRYENLSFSGSSNEKITIRVEFVSDGNFGQTLVNIPGTNDPIISNSGEAYLAKIKDLEPELSIVVSDISNPLVQVERIKAKYYINDKLLVFHDESKSESDRHMVVLIIKFKEL